MNVTHVVGKFLVLEQIPILEWLEVFTSQTPLMVNAGRFLFTPAKSRQHRIATAQREEDIRGRKARGEAYSSTTRSASITPSGDTES